MLSQVLVKLFQNYCCSFYGSVLWKQDEVFLNICTEWNKALRRASMALTILNLYMYARPSEWSVLYF